MSAFGGAIGANTLFRAVERAREREATARIASLALFIGWMLCGDSVLSSVFHDCFRLAMGRSMLRSIIARVVRSAADQSMPGVTPQRQSSQAGPYQMTISRDKELNAAARRGLLWMERERYIQHNAQVPTGLKGFMDTFRQRFAQKLPPDYKRELLNVIGDSDMVVVCVRQSWTGHDGQHHQALGFDMFRVQDDMIAEHWDAD